MMLVLVSAASANTATLSNAESTDYLSSDSNVSEADEAFDFPSDHVLHQPGSIVEDTELFAEWLYWTGSLKDVETGDLYGFQFTLFQMNLYPGSIGYINHVAISDTYNSDHPFFGFSTLPDRADITNGTDPDRGTFWTYKDNQTTLTYWNDLDAWDILTQGNASQNGGSDNTVSLNLTLVNDKGDYYLHWPDGINDKGFCLGKDSEYLAGRSYYYTHPTMSTTGTLTIGGRKINVIGDSWFDHQWGGFGKCYPAWNWFSLCLDDGSYLMLYNLKDPFMNDIEGQRGLTYIDSNGNLTWWHGESAANMMATRWWRSDLFGLRYPLDWVIETPVGNFALQPYFDEQTMDIEGSPTKYWEGIMRVRAGNLNGEQIGIGYLELVGYKPS